MQDNYIAPSRLDAIQHISQVIQIEVIAHRYKNIPWFRSDGFGRELAFHLQVELVHLHMRFAAASCIAL